MTLTIEELIERIEMQIGKLKRESPFPDPEISHGARIIELTDIKSELERINKKWICVQRHHEYPPSEKTPS